MIYRFGEKSLSLWIWLCIVLSWHPSTFVQGLRVNIYLQLLQYIILKMSLLTSCFFLHFQYHSHSSQYWCRRDPTSWTGHHGDSANIRWVANWRHHSHHCSRLGIVSSKCVHLLPDPNYKYEIKKHMSPIFFISSSFGQNVPKYFRFIRLILSNVFLFYRDRFRTMVNVMGDALATGIMAHICRKDFMKEGDGVSFNYGFSSSLFRTLAQLWP